MLYARSLLKTFTPLTLAGAMAMASGFGVSAQAKIQFNAPDDPAPTDTTGGGIRGNISFIAPGDAAPEKTLGGGVRGNVQFQAPGDSVPNQTLGGGVRGEVSFRPPDEDAAPNQTLGGGVRGEVGFRAPDEDAAPNQTLGGGVRGEVIFRAPDEDAAPNQTIGGGTRREVGFLAPDEGAPQQTTGSGTRREELTKIIPLLPPAKYGRTLAARPTMLVYVPPTRIPQQIFFSVQDENRQNLYQTTLELSGNGGIVRITLPESAPELEIGKTYTWFFAPVPSEGFLRPDNYGVIGWVKRVAPPVEIPARANSIDRATAYGASGVWYDMLNLVADAQQSQPENPELAQEWQDLLEQVGLEVVADQPMLQAF